MTINKLTQAQQHHQNDAIINKNNNSYGSSLEKECIKRITLDNRR